MNEEQKTSEEMRGAFVDGQLDRADWARVAETAEHDPALREDVCQLRMLKETVRHAYAALPPRSNRTQRPAWVSWRTAAAAAMVAISGTVGWFAYAWSGDGSSLDAASAYALRGDWHALRADWRTLDRNRILVHVSSDATMGTALDEVEDLLRSARAEHRHIKVEIIANSTGIELLDANKSHYAGRLATLLRQFPQLKVVACGQTLDRLRSKGKAITLLPGTQIAPSALDEVIKRLQAGWIYVRA